MLAGIEANGDPLYVARAKVDGSDSIGKVNPKAHNVCHVPYGGKEQLVRNYQVLVSRPAIQAPVVAPRHQETPEHWVPCSGGGVPAAVLEGGVQGGRDHGTPIYVARMCHPETGLMHPVPGKYHPTPLHKRPNLTNRLGAYPKVCINVLKKKYIYVILSYLLCLFYQA